MSLGVSLLHGWSASSPYEACRYPSDLTDDQWAQALTVLHAAAREAYERAEETTAMVVIDTHLARGASNGGFTFHDRGGPYGRTKGSKRVVAVDVTGLPVGALVVPASTHENRASELMLEHLTARGVTGRLALVLVDRGVTAAAARTLGRDHGFEVRRVRETGPGILRRLPGLDAHVHVVGQVLEGVKVGGGDLAHLGQGRD
ncbi:MAG: Transposase, family [Marmoricola sp.]|nr:Transposase, family [Marmoricola sp.]